MIPSIATVTLGGTLIEKFEAIATANFQAIELFDTDFESFRGTPKELRQRIDNLGLNLASYFPLRNFEGMPHSQQSKVFERAERYLDVAVELGADMVMICSNTDPESMPDLDSIATDLNKLGDLAAQRNLKIAYEGLAWGQHVYDYRRAWDLITRAAHPSVGLVLDAFHILARGIDLSTIKTIPSDRIFLVQVSDAASLDLDYLTWSRHHRVLPGQGNFVISEFIDAVQTTGYNAIVSLECFNDQMRASSPDAIALEGYRTLENLWDMPPLHQV